MATVKLQNEKFSPHRETPDGSRKRIARPRKITTGDVAAVVAAKGSPLIHLRACSLAERVFANCVDYPCLCRPSSFLRKSNMS